MVTYCGANKTQGGKCRQPAGHGTDHVGSGRCKFHGGATKSHRQHAANEAARVMGEEMEIEPHEALLQTVRIAAGEVSYCTAQIETLEKENAVKRGEFGEYFDIWIGARQGALERLAKFSKMAIDAGVAERQVRVAERFGDTIAALIAGIFEDLALTAKQKKAAPAVVRKHLALVVDNSRAA